MSGLLRTLKEMHLQRIEICVRWNEWDIERGRRALDKAIQHRARIRADLAMLPEATPEAPTFLVRKDAS